MNKLKITYHNGDEEMVNTELSAEAYKDSRFGGQPQGVFEATVVEEVVEVKPKVVKK